MHLCYELFRLRNLTEQHPLSVAIMENNFGASMHTNDFICAHATFKLGKGGALSEEAIMDMVCEKIAKLCSFHEVDPTEPLSSYMWAQTQISGSIIWNSSAPILILIT